MIQTGFESRVKIQQVIESQLPEFILDESPNTAEFFKQYYISQEYQGGVVDISENLDQYLKLDGLIPEIISDSIKLSNNISSSSGIVTVTSTKGFPQTYGLLKIDDEIITYTGITTNTFTGCIRGFSGISSYHKNLNQEELVFSESVSSPHSNGSLVQNLSSLFLREFYRKLKYTFTPGLEEFDFVPNLNIGNFIKEAKSFYQSKGTDESFRILFNILYGVSPQVINLENFLIKPSSAEFIRREVVIAERISGDPSKLVGQTLKKVNDENTSASISEVEAFTRDNIQYFKISLFVGYDDVSAVLGNFTITPNTKCLTNVSIGSSVISVDSTIGFPEQGTIVSGNNQINYTSKSINQFFGCTGITSEISSTDNIRSDEIYFGYENGDLNKKVELRLAGVLSKFVQVSDTLDLDEGEIISVRNIGDSIQNPQNNKTYKEIFANSWIYNTASRYEIENISNFTLKSLIDRSSLKIGDEVEILERDTNIVVSSSGAYISDIILEENRVIITNSGFSAEIDVKYDLRRKINTTNSTTVPIQFGNNVILSDIQNLYTDTEYAYVASNSLPSGRDEYNGNFTYNITKNIKSSFAIGISDVIEGNYTSIVFQNSVPFISGDRIYYQPSGTAIVGLDTGDYYVQVLDSSNKIRLYSSKSFLGSDNYLTFFNSDFDNQTHKFTLYSQKSGLIGAQKLLKKFPLSQSIDTGTGEFTIPGSVGMLINGVEIVNYKSDDKIYYGPLKSVSVLNEGIDYDVISPPLISVSPGSGNTALIRPVISGSVKKVYIDSQDYDINTIVSIVITGGNGSNCVLEPVVTKRKRDIFFDGRLTTNSGGISSTTNQLSFLTDHNLSSDELIVYNSNGNQAIGIGTTNLTLIDNSTYYYKIDNNQTIKIYENNSDYLSGINTISFNGINAGGIHKFSTSSFKNTISEIKVLNGGSGYTNRKLIVSSVGISTSNHTINFQKHGFNDGELVVYSPDNFFSSRNPIPLGWVAVNLFNSKIFNPNPWSDLMNEYAIYPSDTLPLSGVNHTVYWDIEVAKEGNYTLKLQADDSSTLFIDGIQVASSTSFSTGGETNVIVTLNKGYHQISGVVYNIPTYPVDWGLNPAGIAWTLEYEPQSVISDLSTSNQYYILKVDSNSFRLCDAGIGGTNISNYNRKNYVRFSSTGSGYQYFSYPDISVSIQYTPVGFGTTTQQIKSLVATPVIRGNIIDAYLYESGIGYGSTILNFEKKPLISIKTGQEAKLKPIIINGQVNLVNIESSGSDYYSIPDLIVTDLTGEGSGADLRAVIVNQKITDVRIINPGIGYSSSSTIIRVNPAGSNALIDVSIRDLTVNHNTKFGDEILRETENQLQYSVCGYFNGLRESFNDYGSQVSNIIGWAYDGNPIYGPYGYSDPKDSNSIPKLLIPGYTLSLSNIIDRPIGFSPGFFVEDHKYTNSGDLDENNGRFGKTPEFPNGIYAYFASIDTFSNPIFPYFIGNKYRSNTIHENSTLNQTFNFNNTDLLRNTLPYKVSDDYAKNDFINEVDQITTQEAIVESVSEGFVNGFDIVNSGFDYKVNDVLNFDDSNTSGGGLIARVSSIEGKDIVKIDTSVETYENAIFTYENGKEVKVTIKPNHNLSNNDFVVISGFSTNLSKLNNSYKITVSSYYSNVLENIPSSPISGLTTEIYVTQIPTTVSVGSSISIGGEILSILEVYKNLNILKVERGSTGVSHTATTQINFIPDSFIIPQKIDYFESKVNNKVFFNPVQSVGIGTTPGAGITTTFKFGDSNITRNIPTQGIYIENHPFANNQQVIFTSNGSNISISTSPTSGTFNLPQNVYVTNKNINTIGIKTSLSSSEVFFRINGSNNDKYSFETTYSQIIGKVEGIKSVVSISTSHELSNQDNIKLTVEPNLSVGIGTSTSIYVKKDLVSGSILINPISFNSSGINTAADTILINSHNLKTGDKVLYSANLIASGLSTGFYYVYRVNDNSIKLCETYIDSQTIPPTSVNINSTGGSNQSISLVNPQIISFKNNNLVFNLSDNSLAGYRFKIYYDNNYKNEFISTPLSGIGTIGVSNNASITINYDNNIPTQLYYNLEKSGYISTSDTEVNNYSEILFVDSAYNSNYKISGVGTTTFNISLFKKPEKLSYIQSECDKLKYTTSSPSAKGPIDKIDIVSGGTGYKKLPIFTGLNSLTGKDAYIVPKSTFIGNSREVRIIDDLFQYSSDKTLQPIALISPLITIKNSNTIDNITVINGGKGYTDAPSIVIVDEETGIKIDSGIINATLSGNSIDSIDIVQKPKGLPEKTVQLYATNNTNGISIQKVESSSTGIFTCFITTPTLGFSVSPFNVGDEVFVEGIQKFSIGGSGFNSEEYGYKFFTVSNYDNTGVLDSLTIDISELTTNTGEAKIVQDSVGSIIKKTDYPSFNITTVLSKFIIGEKLISNNIERDLKISSQENSFIKVFGTYNLSVGEIIIGKESGNIATVNKVKSGSGRFEVDYSVEKNIGWSNDIGKLDQDNQVIPDNDYYQNLSYTIKSPITYQELRTPVNSLLHASGLKNFADTGITSTTNSGITTSENATTIFYDIIEENRVDTVYDFDLVKDIDVIGTSSKFLKLKNKKLTDYIECRTNVVLKIDNINRQFSDADGNPSEFINLVELNSGESYINLLVRISTADNSQIQLSELIILDTGNDLFLAEKATVVNDGAEIITYLLEESIGEFLLISDDNDDKYLRFVPKDPFNTDYDIKLINTNFNSDLPGIGTISVGFVDLNSSNRNTTSGIQTSIISVESNKFSSLYSNIQIIDSIANQMNFAEVYLTHNKDINSSSTTINSTVGIGSTVIFVADTTGLIVGVSSISVVGAAITDRPIVSVGSTFVQIDSASTSSSIIGIGTVVNFSTIIDNTYISEYYFDSEFSSNFYSGNNIGTFGANISSGILSLNYTSNSPNIVNIRSKVVGFGTTSIATPVYRFISPGEIPGNERSVIYQSNYSSTVSSASTVISLNKSDFNAVKSLVEVSVGSTSALHQIMMVQDETNIYVQQLPFLSVGSTNGIGTFGGEYSGSNFILKFYPDSSVTSTVDIVSFNQCLYTTIDTQNIPPSLNYGDITEFIDIKLYNAINGARINRTDFDLRSNNIPIFAKTFDPTNSSTLNPSTGVFTIQNHFFSDLEKLIYTPKSTFIGVGASAVGIGLTLNSVGILTTILPSEVYAIRLSDNTFKLSTRKDYAALGIAVTFTSYGSGNAHQLEMDKKLEKSLITIDNIVQYPLIFTPISYNLSGNGGQIGAGSSIFALSGISTISPEDILRIDNEYMGVINVGLGTTNIGPISNSGGINLVEVKRGFVGSSASTHTDSSSVRIYKGSYNIVDGNIFFAQSPRGNPQIIRDSSNLTFETSDFTGRVFLRNNYTSNQLYDDISNKFTGIGKTFTLTVGGANTVGLGTSGGNGILFINGVFQTPTTINNPENNFSIIENTVSGISSVVFSGIRDPENLQIITSEFDVNQNQTPRGGIIISLGSSTGLGYAPLVGAKILPRINASGEITSIVSTATTGSAFAISTATYYNTTGLFDVTTTTPHGFEYTNVREVTLIGLEFSCAAEHIGVTTTIFPEGVTGIGKTFAIKAIGTTTSFTIDVGISTIPHNYVGQGTVFSWYSDLTSGSGYNGIVAIGVSVYESGHTGAAATITANVGAGGTLGFTIVGAGGGYVKPQIFVSEPSYENLDIIGVSRLGIGTTTDTGVGLLLNVEVEASSTTGIGSTYFEVSRFSISRQGYSFRRGDIFKPVGLVTAKGLASPLSEFKLTVVDTFSDSFAAWQFGEFDYIDSVKNYQDGVRTRFPLFYNNELLSFESLEGSQVNLSNALLIVINGVIQDPGVAYQFEGGSSFIFETAPRSEDNIAIFFYRGTAGDDTVLNTSINESLKRGDIVQVFKNNSITGTVTQNKRTIFDLSFSDKFETNLYSDQGVDTESNKPLSWIKQKVDRKINGENVYKTRDSIESLIYPTSKIIKDFSNTDTTIFVDNAEFFEYDNTSNPRPFSSLIVNGSPDPVSAGITAVVSAAGTIQSLVINISGSGYIGNSVTVKISSPPKEDMEKGIGMGITATATISVGAGGTLTTPITITNPGIGYTSSQPPKVIVPLPDPTYENISQISLIDGFSGIITGITTASGSNGNPLALRFYLNSPSYAGLQTGYPIYIFDSRVGKGITSIDTSNSAVVGIGTTFVDNVYYIHQFSEIGTVGIITCNILSTTSTVGLVSIGSTSNPVGKYSWGRLSGFTRSSSPISIGVSGNTVDVGLSTFPTIQRRGIGIRQTGALPKLL